MNKKEVAGFCNFFFVLKTKLNQLPRDKRKSVRMGYPSKSLNITSFGYTSYSAKLLFYGAV